MTYIIVVPTKSNDPNRLLVVGSIMGQIGVVTWNGYDTYQQGRNSEGVNCMLIKYLFTI